MADWTIDLEFTTKIKVGGDRMNYLLEDIPFAALPAQYWTLGRRVLRRRPIPRAPILVKVTEWLGSKPEAGKDQTYLLRRNVPPPIRRLIFELLQLKDPPRRFSLALAWVRVGKAESERELNVYDCVRSDDQTILHGMFAEEAKAFLDLSMIADRMARKTNRDKSIPWDRPIEWARWAGFALHDVRITCLVERDGGTELTIVDRCRIFRYPLGEYCRALPIPPFPKDFDSSPRHAIVLASYSNRQEFIFRAPAWSTLETVNQVVRSPTHTVLLRGAPGAGKELYAHAIHHLSAHLPETSFCSISTAGVPVGRLQELLTGTMTSGGHTPGYLAKAKGGTLMLDEFDKACCDERERKAFYHWLLRVLEADEYRPEGGNSVLEVEHVAWILAGAFEDVRQIPRDFWSRLSSDVNIPDFDVDKNAITAMFLRFYFVAVLENLKGVTALDLADPKRNDFGINVARGLLVPDDDIADLRHRSFAPRDDVVKFAREFVDRFIDAVFVLDNPLSKMKRLSARTVRQATRAAARSLFFDAKGLRLGEIWREEDRPRGSRSIRFADPTQVRLRDRAMLAAIDVALISLR